MPLISPLMPVPQATSIVLTRATVWCSFFVLISFPLVDIEFDAYVHVTLTFGLAAQNT